MSTNARAGLVRIERLSPRKGLSSILCNAFERLRRTMRRSWDGRRSYRAVADLDDHLLRDIGFERISNGRIVTLS